MRTSRKLSKPSFWRLLLCCFFLLSLSAASLCAGDLQDPAQMTDQQIFDELEILLDQQLTESEQHQETLQTLRTTLESSQLQLGTLRNQLQSLQENSMTLKSSLSDLSISLERISTELRGSASSLQSLSEDIAREAARTRTRETVLICVCGVSLGAVLAMLLASFIRN